jgi:aerobic carbon-monoxide dehydrogenase medium subunit
VLIRPTTLEDALAALEQHGPAATLIAGGQSLVPMMSAGLVRPQVLVDLGAINAQFAPYHVDVDDVVIGLGCTHRQLESAPSWLADAAPLLPAAAPHIASLAIRNRGTFIGSLAHGDPSAEWPAVAMALDAEVEIVSRQGHRTESFHDFLVGPMTTTLNIAQVSVDESSVVRDPRIAVFGVGDLPWRAREVEAELEGTAKPDLAAVGDLAAHLVEAISDASASAEYRKRMTGVMVRRGLEAAVMDATARRARDEGR